MYSFLLLDFVIKVPLLLNVVNVIYKNRWELVYTGILLLIVIYIYSFLAIFFLWGKIDDDYN